MMQMSTYVYCDALFEKLDLKNVLLPSPYRDFPYLIIKNFFPKEVCRDLVSLVQKDEKVKAKIKKESISGVIGSAVVEKYRKTNMAQLDDYYEKYYAEQFSQYKPEIEAYFSVAIALSTKVQVLEYTKGFFYMKHADDSSEIINKAKETVGFKVVAPQRKLSTVLFATSHVSHKEEESQCFSGGELMFNYLFDSKGSPIEIKPEAGDMIVFPSNPYFSHEVLPVEDGYRLTLVQWHDTV